MFKMMKYEYKRAMGPLLIVFSVFALLEAYFFIGTAMKKQEHSAIAMVLFMVLAFACYLFVLVYGIASYNKDLKSKEGYLVFMAPISSFAVIGAKLLATLLTGITLVVMLFILGSIDYSFAAEVYHLDGLLDFFKAMLESIGTTPSAITGGILIFIVTFLVQFFMMTTLGYMAISLSSTVLQNKKIKTFISFVLYFVLLGGVNGLALSLPNVDNLSEMAEHTSLLDQFVFMLPQLGLYVVVMIACYIVSSLLLEKKISL